MASTTLSLDEQMSPSLETPFIIDAKLDYSKPPPHFDIVDSVSTGLVEQPTFASDASDMEMPSLFPLLKSGSHVDITGVSRSMMKIHSISERLHLNHRVPRPVGDVVEIEHVERPLPMEAFEISDEFKKSMSNREVYHYKRSAKRSLMLGFGLSASAGDGTQGGSDVLDPYTKADDRTCVYNYMGCIISFGVLSLPQVMADCGLVPGLLAILAFSGLNNFWAHRLIELPQLVRRNLEHYGDIAKVFFPNFHHLACISLVATWYGMALLGYYCTLYYSRHHKIKMQHPMAGYSMEVFFCLAFTFMSFRSSVKENQERCVLGMKLMYVVLALVSLACVHHGFTHSDTNTYHLCSKDLHRLAHGVMKVGMAFTGLGILPYVVSEMLNPGNARAVADRAMLNITGFYVWFALVGYFGFGDAVADSVAREIERIGQDDRFYWLISITVTLLLMGKSLLTYPIFYLPMLREFEGCAELDESPPVSLGLPWAIESLRRTKLVLRILPSIMLFFIYQACNNFRLVAAVCVIPFFLTQMILPSVLSLKAMDLNWHLRARHVSGGGDWKRASNDVLFGAETWQVMLTVVLAIFSIGLGLMAIMACIYTVQSVGLSGMRFQKGIHDAEEISTMPGV